MKLSREEVEHIALLARLELTEAEKERYATELSAILGYVERLQEIDTTNVEPTSYITETLDALRPDTVVQLDEATRAELINEFPSSRADLLVVPPVFSDYKE
ncbi:MAG: Asp-tRNA(Asn)/Glu-tRNA(Gln) amidotransferase subunit GatC [Candidatus Magasanikbacteria bacterium]|nr:Asp-tRNA(Asn)/Glu-tRNA(Gln) amidotransferase subunit GatC [Candidatus Magasanikbacteria bacterium]